MTQLVAGVLMVNPQAASGLGFPVFNPMPRTLAFSEQVALRKPRKC